MEFKKEQKLISDIIGRELEVEIEKDLEYMEEQEIENHQKNVDTAMELMEILKSKLDREHSQILVELLNIYSEIGFQENKYFFERGVRCGLTTLNYLKKYYNCF